MGNSSFQGNSGGRAAVFGLQREILDSGIQDCQYVNYFIFV